MYSIIAIATDPLKRDNYDAFIVDLEVKPDDQSEITLSNEVADARRFSTPQEATAFASMSCGKLPDGTFERPLFEFPILIVTKDD